MREFDRATKVFDFMEERKPWMDKHGLEIQNDLFTASEIIIGLEKYDNGCPCFMNHPQCPCPTALPLINKKGSCHCGLFFKAKEYRS